MRSAVSLVVVAGLLAGVLPAGSARADAERGRVARVLKTFAIRPPEATPHCALRWRSTPYWLEPGEQIVETIISGWFGFGTEITKSTIRLGISSVYWEGEAGTLSVLALAFRGEEAATAAEKILHERYAEKTAHRFARKGSWLLIFAVPPPANEPCVEWMWQDLRKRLAAAR